MEWTKILSDHIEKSGYDGVVVKMYKSGKDYHMLHNIFRDDQIIPFTGGK